MSSSISVSPIGDRRRDIQGLRAVAVLMVVAFHAGLPVPGGFVGVDVFFVISGFVITAMLHRELAASGRIRFGLFYLRRFKRLTPALALTVFVTLLIAALVLSPLGTQQIAVETGIGALLLVANFVIASSTGGYFDAPAETNPLLNTWSLSVEEQFYLVFPALLALGWFLAQRRRFPKSSPYLIVSGVAVASFSVAIVSNLGFTLPGPQWLFGFYSPVTRAWEFAAGALLALVYFRRPVVSSGLITGCALTGVLLLTTSLWVISSTTTFPGIWTLMPVVGTVLLLLAGSDSRALSTRALSVRPLVKIGDWSYSIYLWHWPLIVFAVYLWPQSEIAAPAAALIAFAPALASYRWVEEPIRNLRSRGWAGNTGLAAVVVLPVLVFALIVDRVADHYWWPKYASGEMRQYEGDVGHDEFHSFVDDRYYPCTPEAIRRHALYWGDFLRCQQSLPKGPVKVALVGDSHAEHLFLGLADTFPETNIAYYILGILPIASAGSDMARIIDHVADDPGIRTVLVAANWQATGVPTEELKVTLERFTNAGKTVFLVDDVPVFPFEPVQCRERKAPVIRTSECTLNSAENRDSHKAYVDELQQVVRHVPEVQLLNIYKYFCSADTCSMVRGRKLLFRDWNHLNMNGTRYVAKRLARKRTFAKALAPR